MHGVGACFIAPELDPCLKYVSQYNIITFHLALYLESKAKSGSGCFLNQNVGTYQLQQNKIYQNENPCLFSAAFREKSWSVNW